MELKTSLDFDAIETALLMSTCGISSNENLRQMFKLIKNLRAMNTKLSQYEVADRGNYSKLSVKTREQVLLINNEINSIEQWITLLLLS